MTFRFENTHELSEREYGAIWAVTNRARPVVWARRLALFFLGALLLRSPYTILLGVTVLALSVVSMTTPHWLPGTSARTFRSTRYLRGPVSYGADTDGVWVRTDDFLARVAWRHVTVWREREGWLVLQGRGFPPVLLSTVKLREQGLYDRVKSLAEQHAVEYDSAAARRQAV